MAQSATEYLFPDWNKGGSFHNWRNHITDKLKELWSTFTDEQKKAIYEQAEEMANREEYE